jgi:hypothetical protein
LPVRAGLHYPGRSRASEFFIQRLGEDAAQFANGDNPVRIRFPIEALDDLEIGFGFSNNLSDIDFARTASPRF